MVEVHPQWPAFSLFLVEWKFRAQVVSLLCIEIWKVKQIHQREACCNNINKLVVYNSVLKIG